MNINGGLDDVLNVLDTGNVTVAQTVDSVNLAAVETVNALPFVKAFAAAGILWFLYNLKRR